MKYFYFEWIYPIKDYYKSSEKREKIFDMGVPLIISIIVMLVCIFTDKSGDVSNELANPLFQLTSVLIGFSIMLVTILMTSGGSGIEELKNRTIKKELYNENISLFQKLHIQFIYSLMAEVILLLIIMLFYFLHTSMEVYAFDDLFLLIFVYDILNILFSLIRGITNIYFSFYNNTN